MARTLQIELSEPLYDALVREADLLGYKPERVIAERLANSFNPNQNDKKASLSKLLRHAGAIDSGDPNGGDNDLIDADLDRERGRSLDNANAPTDR